MYTVYKKPKKREIEILLKGKPKKATGFKPPLKMVFSPVVVSFVCVALSAAAARSSSSCGLRFFPAKRFVMYVADGGVVVSLAPLAAQLAIVVVSCCCSCSVNAVIPTEKHPSVLACQNAGQ